MLQTFVVEAVSAPVLAAASTNAAAVKELRERREEPAPERGLLLRFRAILLIAIISLS